MDLDVQPEFGSRWLYDMDVCSYVLRVPHLGVWWGFCVSRTLSLGGGREASRRPSGLPGIVSSKDPSPPFLTTSSRTCTLLASRAIRTGFANLAISRGDFSGLSYGPALAFLLGGQKQDYYPKHGCLSRGEVGAHH